MSTLEHGSTDMNDRDFEPHIEGVLSSDNDHPVFVKALTHGTRVVRLPRGFVDQSDHLNKARHLVITHHRKYMQRTLAEKFPICFYKYMTTATRSVRISVDGRVLGIFKDVPANPSFGITTADGKTRMYKIVDE